MSRVLVTGGSGFVGSAIITELVARRHSVHALVNQREIEGFGDSVRSFKGGLFDNHAIDEAMNGCDAVIHVVGIIMEKRARGITFERIHHQGTRAIVDGAKRNGIGRYIQMSALGSRPDAQSNYHKTKFLAEEYVRASGLDWTIIRPSLIHGPKGEFMQMEAMWSRMKAPAPVFFMPFMPYFGAGLLGLGGAGMLQPVYVNDVARAFVDSLDNNKHIGEVYLLGGPDQLTWPHLHQTISQAVVGRKRLVLPIPAWYAKILAAVGIGAIAGFNRDQIIMSQEENTCDLTKFTGDFGWEPKAFEPTLKEYAGKL